MGGVGARATEPDADRTLRVALGRRVEVIGDLLLPAEPTDSSRAASRDIGRRLEEWQGPGIVILCGRLVAPGCPAGASTPPPWAATRSSPPRSVRSRPATTHRSSRSWAAERDPELVQALERCGVTVREAIDLACETGAGTRMVLVRAGTIRPDANPPVDAAPADERPWLVGMERLDDPRLARRFVTSRLLYRRLRRYLWAPPLVLAAIALLLRIDFVVDGLGRIFRSPRQQDALQRAYAATWFSRFIVTVVIAVALLAVLALVVAVTSRAASGVRSGARACRPRGRVASRDATHRPCPARDRRGGRPRLHARHRRGRRIRGRRRRSARARAHPPRRRLLRLPGRHLRGRARAPGTARAATDVPASSPGGDPGDRDRGGPARPPPPRRGRPAHGDHGRAAGDLRHRDQGPLQGGRGPRGAGGRLAERRVVAARPRGGGGPHPGAAHSAHRRCLPVRGRSHRRALLGHDPAAPAPASDRDLPARRRRPGRRGADRHRRHRHDHALPRHPEGSAALLAGGGRAPRRLARSPPPPRRWLRHPARVRGGPRPADRPARLFRAQTEPATLVRPL